MRSYRAAAVAIAAVLFPASVPHAQAAEIGIFSPTALKGVLDQLRPQFEKATGNKLVFTIDPAAVMKSIGFNGVGASRVGIDAVFAKLGIAEAVKPKVVLLQASASEGIAKGDVAVARSPMSAVLAVPGAQLAGPVPAEFQSYLVLSGAVSANSTEAAQKLIKYLTAARGRAGA